MMICKKDLVIFPAYFGRDGELLDCKIYEIKVSTCIGFISCTGALLYCNRLKEQCRGPPLVLYFRSAHENKGGQVYGEAI